MNIDETIVLDSSQSEQAINYMSTNVDADDLPSGVEEVWRYELWEGVDVRASVLIVDGCSEVIKLGEKLW